jgi:transcription initiation factor TFIID subunit 15
VPRRKSRPSYIGPTLTSSSGQANSQTSTNNFINICAGKVLTNGLQQVGGSCNGIPMGDIPEQKNTPSTLITSPQNGQDVAANQGELILT